MIKPSRFSYGTTHLYNGQEAIATAICDLLSPDDLILQQKDQHVQDHNDGWMEITATVVGQRDADWWLRGFKSRSPMCAR